MRTAGWGLAALVLVALLAAVPPAAAMMNPSAGYCGALGYTYSIQMDGQGNEIGYCTLPNGQTVSAWQFLLGQTGQEYSYCGKMGYATRIVNDSKACGIFNRQSCAACVFPNGSAMEVTQAMGLDFREMFCTSLDCREPKDYPMMPYLIPPPGGQQQGAPLPSWMILAGVILVLVVIAGIFLMTYKKEKSS
jgi:putative hemolysin